MADIHFDYRLALLSIDAGVSKVRINPGNIGSMENVKKVAAAAKEKGVPIRIGVNSGSIEKELGAATPENMVKSAKKHIKMLEDCSFYDIAVSLKASDVRTTVEAYRLASKSFDYPASRWRDGGRHGIRRPCPLVGRHRFAFAFRHRGHDKGLTHGGPGRRGARRDRNSPLA